MIHCTLKKTNIENKKTITIEIPQVIKDIPEKKLSTIPNCCGAYVIKVKSGKIYVGSSKTLRNRILQHKDKFDPNISISDKIISTCYYKTNTHQEARIMENWLIREINPELNKTNKINSSKRGCGAKCLKNCETWDSPGKKIKFDVNIVEFYKDIPEIKFPELPKKSGVYVITTKFDEQYVGSSTNVRSRVKEHHSLKGENIKESIKSVSCYITENRTDAYILEYHKIKELAPKLNREFRDDAWTWKLGELRHHFEKRPELVGLFKEFSTRIRFNLSRVEEVVRKDRVAYRISALKHVFFIKFMSGYLQIDLKDEDDRINDSSEFLTAIKPKQSDIFHKRIKLSKISEIDKAMEILQQAYIGVRK